MTALQKQGLPPAHQLTPEEDVGSITQTCLSSYANQDLPDERHRLDLQSLGGKTFRIDMHENRQTIVLKSLALNLFVNEYIGPATCRR